MDYLRFVTGSSLLERLTFDLSYPQSICVKEFILNFFSLGLFCLVLSRFLAVFCLFEIVLNWNETFKEKLRV